MSSTCLRATFVAVASTFLSTFGWGGELRVPADYARIQSAIDASHGGDTIVVSPGVYHENLNFKGKAVTLTSTNPADPNVVAGTIIHASGQSSVVSFVSGETTNSVLAGFTITGGYGTVNAGFGTNIFWGGGIYCYGASPTIVGNVIRGNAAPSGDASVFGYGAAIGCIGSDAVIGRNVITANTGYGGAGLLTYLGKVRIVSNLIISNAAVIGGGAVLISGAQFMNNTLMGNAAQAAGHLYALSDSTGQTVSSGNIFCDAGSGGGVYLDSQDSITRFAFNDVWNNAGGDYYEGQIRTGLDGNISQDPLFADVAHSDYRLQDGSPCVNAGDPGFQPLAAELDFYGNARVWAGRVDIGAAEYFDPLRPSAEAGPNQFEIVTALPALIALDGSASSDPNGAGLSYHWSQLSGPSVSLSGPGTAKPWFNAPELATYVFQLIVDNGTYSSLADTVTVVITNTSPTASAGNNQRYPEGTALITLDGSRSFDPENVPLSYEWTQLDGWRVQLSDSHLARPTFAHPWPGTYVFQLVVSDGLQNSQPSVVTIVVGPNHAPIADAGFSRYVATGSITLDGTRSYDPDGGSLTYQWTQLSGPKVTMAGTNTATPSVSGFTPIGARQTCVFQLVVGDGSLVSRPASVTVTIVPNFGTNALYLENPPFDPARPTIVAFGGGNCTTGGGMSFGGVWDSQANWITVQSYGSSYNTYGDMMMVYLSSVAPDYRQPIQTIGFSTGNKPAMQAAYYVNAAYRDARYAVNRVALCDAVCNNLSTMVAQFHANPVGREQCLVDNYVSNDSQYSKASYIPGALNVICNPARAHSYPVNRYATSSLNYTNGGLTAFGYLSVIGSGKNYQLNTASNKYYFIINSSESIVFYNQTAYPGKILAPVQLAGPASGTTVPANGAAFGCQQVENAVRYQLLFGADPTRVMDFSVVLETTNPPAQVISTLPLQNTWWTMKAFDQFGSSIYADPWLIKLPENQPPVADAGPNLVLYAGLDGKAAATLSGAGSADPEGAALSYTWAWALDGTAYESSGESLTIDLPIGVHVVQLMVNDGRVDSQPAGVVVTVVAPMECGLKITPSAINLRSSGPNIHACLRFPDASTTAQVDYDAPLLLYPGSAQATKLCNADDGANGQALFAFFARDTLSGAVQSGPVELMVVGRLKSGQWFFGRDIVKVIGKGK